MLPWLPVSPPADGQAAAIAQPFVLIEFPEQDQATKRWPVERYAEVARELHHAGYTVVMNSGPGEELIADELIALSAGAGTTLKATLTDLIAITRRASLVIAGDTGPSAPCQRARQAGRRHLRPHRSCPQRTLRRRISACCAIRKAAATTRATKRPKPAC